MIPCPHPYSALDPVTVWCNEGFFEKLINHPIISKLRKIRAKALHKERMQYLRRKGARK